VRSLRKKLGPFAPSIETVTGHGYRFGGWKKVSDDVQ
jgi:DNA-binding response OmpR family regulator